MDHAQVVLQQPRGPKGRVVPVIAGVLVDDFNDQRVNDPQRCWRSAAPRIVAQAFLERSLMPFSKSANPVVQGLSTDAEEIGKALKRPTVIEPQQGFGPTTFSPGRGTQEELLELLAFQRCQ